MVKIKYDTTGVDHEQAAKGGGDPPKPGVYSARIKEMNTGFSKGDDGKPDKSRPRVEVIFELTDKEHKGFPLWYYLTFGSGFPAQKMSQFLQAVGVPVAKRQKGEFDTDDILNSKNGCTNRVKVQVQGEKNTTDYRPRVTNVLRADDPDGDEDGLGGDEEVDFDALGEAADNDEADAISTLEGLASEAGLDPDSYPTWAELAAALSGTQGDEDAGGGDDDEPASEGDADQWRAWAEAADNEDDQEAAKSLEDAAIELGFDANAYDTWAELAEAMAEGETGESDTTPDDAYDDMDVTELRKMLKERELDTKGAKPALVARLREADENEDPF